MEVASINHSGPMQLSLFWIYTCVEYWWRRTVVPLTCLHIYRKYLWSVNTKLTTETLSSHIPVLTMAQSSFCLSNYRKCSFILTAQACLPMYNCQPLLAAVQQSTSLSFCTTVLICSIVYTSELLYNCPPLLGTTFWTTLCCRPVRFNGDRALICQLLITLVYLASLETGTLQIGKRGQTVKRIKYQRGNPV